MRNLQLFTLFGLLILTMVDTVRANDSPDEPITVQLSEVEKGIFNVNQREKVGSRLPVYETTDYLNTETNDVTIKKNRAFGSRFQVDADRGRLLQFLTVWSMPAMDVPGQKEPVKQKSTLGLVENHDVYKFTYRLDHSWEMQPGQWTLQVFLVGVDKDKVRRIADLSKSPYWIEVYRESFTLKPASETEGAG